MPTKILVPHPGATQGLPRDLATDPKHMNGFEHE